MLTDELAAALAHIRPGTRWSPSAPGGYVLAAAGLPRRPPRHHALGVGRALPAALPAGPGRPGRPVHRRRGRPDLGRCGRRASTSACTSCAATTAPRSPTTSPAAPSCRRTGTAARRSTSSVRCPSRSRPPRRPHGPGRSGGWNEPIQLRDMARAGVDVRTHLHPPLPRGGRASAPGSGSPSSGWSGRGTCWSPRTCRSTRWRGTPGFGTATVPAAASAGGAGGVAHGLPADVPVDGRGALRSALGPCPRTWRGRSDAGRRRGGGRRAVPGPPGPSPAPPAVDLAPDPLARRPPAPAPAVGEPVDQVQAAAAGVLALRMPRAGAGGRWRRPPRPGPSRLEPADAGRTASAARPDSRCAPRRW